MKGKRYLAKNMLFLTVGQFGTKLLSFFLVPLYTSVLTSAEYGTYDLYSATVSLFVPLLTLNISDSTTIFLLDKANSKARIITVSLKFYSFSLLIFGAAILANLIFDFLPLFNEFPLFLFLMFAVNGLSNLLLCYARGLDRIKDVSVSGVLCSTMMIALNLIFLLPLHLGLKGYYLATIGGAAVQILYLCVSIRIFKFVRFEKDRHCEEERHYESSNRHSELVSESTNACHSRARHGNLALQEDCRVKPDNDSVQNVVSTGSTTAYDKKSLQKSMLGYSCPMMLNTISWWINNVSDRYMVTAFCGVVANGIYSVAYKIPSIMSVFQAIFNQAWTLSAVQDFDSEDKNGFFSKMYSLYNVCMVLLCSVLIFADRLLARILYAKDFYVAWKYVPFLLVSVLFGSLSGYLGGIFAAVKDSKSFASSTVSGAVLNIILNFFLIKVCGSLGAAAATMASYVLVWAMRLWKAKKIMRLEVSLLRDCVSYLLLVFQCVAMLFSDKFGAWSYVANGAVLVLLCVVYRKSFADVAEFVGRKIFKKEVRQ